MNQLRSKMVQQLVRNESTEIDIFRFPIKIWIHSLSVINFRKKDASLALPTSSVIHTPRFRVWH